MKKKVAIALALSICIGMLDNNICVFASTTDKNLEDTNILIVDENPV